LRKKLEEKYKQLKQVKSTIALDSLLENQSSLLNKFCIGFQKGESNSRVGNNKNLDPKRLVENNSSNKSSNKGKKKHI